VPVLGPLFSSSEPAGHASKMPAEFTALIPRGAEWQYLVGGDPGPQWTTAAGGAGWKTGRAGFGYEDDDDVTQIPDMRGKHRFLCVRRVFELTGKEDLTRLGLAIAYDDGFICYLNGKEVVRANVKSGALRTASGVRPHEASGKFKFFPLAFAADSLNPGPNVIAIEIHNDDLDSSDLTLDPYLIIATGGSDEPAVKDPTADD
jgi:hypothetical protein